MSDQPTKYTYAHMYDTFRHETVLLEDYGSRKKFKKQWQKRWQEKLAQRIIFDADTKLFCVSALMGSGKGYFIPKFSELRYNVLIPYLCGHSKQIIKPQIDKLEKLGYTKSSHYCEDGSEITIYSKPDCGNIILFYNHQGEKLVSYLDKHKRSIKSHNTIVIFDEAHSISKTLGFSHEQSKYASNKLEDQRSVKCTRKRGGNPTMILDYIIDRKFKTILMSGTMDQFVMSEANLYRPNLRRKIYLLEIPEEFMTDIEMNHITNKTKSFLECEGVKDRIKVKDRINESIGRNKQTIIFCATGNDANKVEEQVLETFPILSLSPDKIYKWTSRDGTIFENDKAENANVLIVVNKCRLAYDNGDVDTIIIHRELSHKSSQTRGSDYINMLSNVAAQISGRNRNGGVIYWFNKNRSGDNLPRTYAAMIKEINDHFKSNLHKTYKLAQQLYDFIETTHPAIDYHENENLFCHTLGFLRNFDKNGRPPVPNDKRRQYDTRLKVMNRLVRTIPGLAEEIIIWKNRYNFSHFSSGYKWPDSFIQQFWKFTQIVKSWYDNMVKTHTLELIQIEEAEKRRQKRKERIAKEEQERKKRKAQERRKREERKAQERKKREQERKKRKELKKRKEEEEQRESLQAKKAVEKIDLMIQALKKERKEEKKKVKKKYKRKMNDDDHHNHDHDNNNNEDDDNDNEGRKKSKSIQLQIRVPNKKTKNNDQVVLLVFSLIKKIKKIKK